MKIRRAQEKDMERIHMLLDQVALVHHRGRPDLFKYGTRKYTDEELKKLIHNDSRPIFVAADQEDCVQGYAFCIFQQYVDHNIMTDIKTLYIDDLCVEETQRGKHIGRELYSGSSGLRQGANGCYNVTLNVWSCNEAARKFYENLGLRPQKIGMEKILQASGKAYKHH